LERKPIDILVFIEHAARELDVSCAIKSILEQRYQMTMEIASLTWDMEKTLASWQPRVVALPYGYSASVYGICDIVPTWPNAIYLNLAYEQLFTKINQVFKAPSDDFARNHIWHSLWGEFASDYLVKYGVPRDHIFINGNPVYQLYREPYCRYFKSRAELATEYGLDMNKRWVFIPENYGAAFYSEYKIQDVIVAGNRVDDAYAYREFARQSFSEAVRWWNRGAMQDGIEMIVRPRPLVAKSIFAKACEDVIGTLPEHFRLIKDGTVREWILASDLTMSSYSTTLIEAAVARRPVYMLTPIPFPKFVVADWYAYLPKIETGDEFIEKISQGVIENTSDPLRIWAEKEMMTHGDAIANIADWIVKMATVEDERPALYSSRKPSDFRISNALKTGNLPFIMRYLRRVAATEWHKVKGDIPDRSFKGHEQDRIESAVVNKNVCRWSEILGKM
jgi:hypothetical protein